MAKDRPSEPSGRTQQNPGAANPTPGRRRVQELDPVAAAAAAAAAVNAQTQLTEGFERSGITAAMVRAQQRYAT